ncbi:PilZ domain-containing protein [Dasania marina]|uniref:PilZ domain-containing protein n=1 Tax=Dasania marina TaxID=471499 RepID=UPI0030D8D565|tara:strand:+ start:53841 stop:54203 length:363 start_codon:yes stop_codon:yes gene_type:complete
MNNNDKRSEGRVNEQTTIFVEAYDSTSFNGTKVVICNSLDISANGLQFQMDERPELGSILRLFAEFHDQQTAMQLVGEVKWVVPQGQDFNIGFAIYDAENTDIIQWKQLIAQRLEQGEDD